MTHSEISDQRHALERARRERQRALMEDYDRETYWPKRKALMAACAEAGHKWRFTHFGPLGDPWFGCGACHATKVERES